MYMYHVPDMYIPYGPCTLQLTRHVVTINTYMYTMYKPGTIYYHVYIVPDVT